MEVQGIEKIQGRIDRATGLKINTRYSRKYPFSSRIYCGFCGTVLTRRKPRAQKK